MYRQGAAPSRRDPYSSGAPKLVRTSPIRARGSEPDTIRAALRDDETHALHVGGKITREMAHARILQGGVGANRVDDSILHYKDWHDFGASGGLRSPSFSNPGRFAPDGLLAPIYRAVRSDQLHLSCGIVAASISEPKKIAGGLLGVFAGKKAPYLHLHLVILPPAALEATPAGHAPEPRRLRIDHRFLGIVLNMNLPRELGERLRSASAAGFTSQIRDLLTAGRDESGFLGRTMKWIYDGFELGCTGETNLQSYRILRDTDMQDPSALTGVRNVRGDMSH